MQWFPFKWFWFLHYFFYLYIESSGVLIVSIFTEELLNGWYSPDHRSNTIFINMYYWIEKAFDDQKEYNYISDGSSFGRYFCIVRRCFASLKLCFSPRYLNDRISYASLLIIRCSVMQRWHYNIFSFYMNLKEQ